MKALCLYNHREYGAPMVRSAKAFRAHGIEMTVVHVKDEKDARQFLNVNFDVLLLQEPEVHESMLDCGKPVILLERVDGAQLRASRKYLPQVAGVIKSYLFRDRNMYNTVNDRAHIPMIRECGVPCERPLYRAAPPEPQLSEGSLAKLRCGYSGFGCHGVMKMAIDTPVDFDADRPIDVHFAGTVNYEGTEVDSHRRLAVTAARTWKGTSFVSEGRKLNRPEYNAGILQSKTVLCPWGWGEGSYREYEAMLLGAVVIKPNTDYVESCPDIYQSLVSYVPCRPDFSDADFVIRCVSDNWGVYRSLREHNRRVLIEAWQPESIAARMSLLIKELT